MRLYKIYKTIYLNFRKKIYDIDNLQLIFLFYKKLSKIINSIKININMEKTMNIINI